jgi:hypothetical protein
VTWTPTLEAELRWHVRQASARAKCASKKKFATEGSALFSAEHTGAKFRVKLSAYSCTFCGFWHLTSRQPQRELEAA